MTTCKKISSVFGLLALVGILAVPLQSSAQYVSGYYPTPLPVTQTACVSLNSNLRYGSSDYSTGADVTRLQNFLTSTGYLVNTVSTGYYGTATYNAIIRFQAANAISTVGYVGPVTRSKIYSLSCGGYVSPANPIAPINPIDPVYPGYGYSNVSLSSLSSSYGSVGSTVTIYGTGFQSTNNTIHFGGGTIQNVTSYNGTSLTFSIPSQLSSCNQYSCTNTILYVAAGSYPLSVTNSYGTSNQLNFTVTNGGNYPYGGYNGGNGSGYGQPVINNIQAPTSLSLGQTGTWTMNATDPYNQSLTYSVNWGDQYNYGYATNNVATAYNGQTSTFTHSYSTAGTFTPTFTVTDSAGYTAQTSATVNVGNTNCPYYTSSYNNSNSYNSNCGTGYTNGAPSITSISPTQANVGTTITIYGNGFTSNNNTINFGGGAIQNISSYNGTSLTFTVPSSIGPVCSYGSICPDYRTVIQQGSYGLTVMNANGTSNQITFTVGYGSSGNNGVTLSSVTPTTGPANTQVTLYGTGFTSNETIHFGSSIIQNVYSNGNSLTFYIPSQQGCTYASSGSYGTNCTTYYQPTNAGNYQIYVSDQYGSQQSNSISFNVTGNTSSNNGVNLTSVTSNARIGSSVTIYGTGFDYSGNSVFINGTQIASNVYSYGNGSLQFTLPQYAGAQYLSPGSAYTLTATNSSGSTSNSLTFTVGY